MKILIIIFALSALIITGCGTNYWYRQDTSVSQAEDDFTQCYRNVYQFTDADRQVEFDAYWQEKLDYCMETKNYRQIGQQQLTPAKTTKFGQIGHIEYNLAGDRR